MSRPTQNEYFMSLARLAGSRSNCLSRQVGCILVNDQHQVLSTGYNGVPRGFPHCTEGGCPRMGAKSGEDLHKCLAVHAEQNALIFCPDPHKIYAAYITVSPCLTCMVMLLNTQCNLIVFDEIYDKESIKLWEKTGRRWICTNSDVSRKL